MKRSLIFLSALLLILPVALFAQGRCDHGGRMGKGMGMGMGMQGGMCGGAGCFRSGMILKMADDLGLTDAQKSQIMKLNEQDGLAGIDRKAALEKAQLNLHQLMMNNGAEEDVLSAMDEVGKLRTDMRKAQFQHMRKVKAVLTPDQIKKFKELCGKQCDGNGPKGGGMGQGMGMGMGMMDPSDPPMNHPGCNMPCGRR